MPSSLVYVYSLMMIRMKCSQCKYTILAVISQVSASDADESEQMIQGLCAFLLGICLLFNDDQNEMFTV